MDDSIIKRLSLFLEQQAYISIAERKYDDFKRDLLREGSSNELFSLLDVLLMSEEYGLISEVPPNTKLYRARKIELEDIHNISNGIDITMNEDSYITNGYDEKNSKECPLGVGFPGRNNIEGMSYLYVADDPATACAEIKTPLRDLISLGVFEVKRPLRIVDFSSDKNYKYEDMREFGMSLGRLMTNLMFQYCMPVANKDDYRISQIVSDYIRKMGFDGVSYRSFYTMKNNYTIFHSHRSYIQFVESRIIAHQYMDDVYWDFNEKCALHANDGNNMEYDENDAKDILKALADNKKDRIQLKH